MRDGKGAAAALHKRHVFGGLKGPPGTPTKTHPVQIKSAPKRVAEIFCVVRSWPHGAKGPPQKGVDCP